MAFKVFLACFLGLLAVNISDQSSTSVKLFVVEGLDKVLKISTAFLIHTDKMVDFVNKEYQSVNRSIALSAIKTGNGANQIIFQRIDGFKDAATEDGKAVIDCIDGEKADSEAALSKFYMYMGTCAFEEFLKVLPVVKTMLKQLHDVNNDIQEQTNTLRSCSEDELTCLSGFTSTIAETVWNNESKYSEFVQLLRIVIKIVRDCNDDIVKTVKSDFQEIFNKAVVCIKK